jgi:hypothetical protein
MISIINFLINWIYYENFHILQNYLKLYNYLIYNSSKNNNSYEFLLQKFLHFLFRLIKFI